jgi:F0F1-type ATP synthase epsilon subunit
MKTLTLTVLTPAGIATETECTSVTLFARDNGAGEGGGSVGIRPGHLPAVIALAPGSSVKCSSDGRLTLSVTVSGGFATVRDDKVTVVAESAH